MEIPDRRPPTAEAVVRRAGPEDDLALAALAHEHYGGDVHAWHERMRHTPSRPDGCTFIAEHDGEVVGYGRAAWCLPRGDQDTAPAGLYLTGVVVAPASRRRGIGEALTRARLRWARGRAGEVWMFTDARNEASLVMHRRLGFVEVGRASSYLGEPFDAGAGVLLRAEPDRPPLRFEALRLPQDTAALVGFLTRQPWPFHVGATLAPVDVEAHVAAGAYDGATTRTFWIVDETGPPDLPERAGLVRLEDVGDGDPLFDLRVDAGHRGRGIATEAVRWLTRWLFTELPDVERVEAQTRIDNVAMRRVLERCGYAKEAHYRLAWPGEGGAVHDGVGYAVLRHDWASGTVTPVSWDGRPGSPRASATTRTSPRRPAVLAVDHLAGLPHPQSAGDGL